MSPSIPPPRGPTFQRDHPKRQIPTCATILLNQVLNRLDDVMDVLIGDIQAGGKTHVHLELRFRDRDKSYSSSFCKSFEEIVINYLLEANSKLSVEPAQFASQYYWPLEEGSRHLIDQSQKRTD